MTPLTIDPSLTRPVPGMAQPQPEQSERQLVQEVDDFYTHARSDRRPHEVQWFLNAAFIRGQHWVQWNEMAATLETQPAPPHRIRLSINHTLSKVKARQARFLQNRFEPYVIPASNERRDKLDARATQGWLRYFIQKDGLERKYRVALNWANTAGRGYWWFYYDPTKIARVKMPIGPNGEEVIQEVPLGDICIEPGSPFELLVGDPGASSLAEQTRIMRVKIRPVSEVRARYRDKAALIQADMGPTDLFQYQRQIANLATRGYSGATGAGTYLGSSEERKKDHVAVKELFERPSPEYPKGRYTVVAGGVLLRHQDELPYGFWDMPNPFPVVEFPDLEIAGQYWCPTIVEMLMAVNKEYNLIRSKAAEQIRLQAHPKVIVDARSKFPANAWTSEPGEVIRVLLPPGAMAPMVIKPDPIVADTWRHLDIIRQEMDTITNLWPASHGNTGGTNSGFQVNLLQEAANSVHAPDIRLHELAWEEAMYKLRRMAKQFYTVPRMLSVRGKNSGPEVFEFYQNNIDEHAEIRIFTGSALASSPAVRTKQVMEMHAAGMLGQDPNKAGAKALKLIDLDGVSELQDEVRRDEEQAHLENAKFERGEATFATLPPMPWDNHERHWEVHCDLFKSPEFEAWPVERKREAILHAVYHAKYINPTHAFNLAQELGLQELIPLLAPLVMAAQPPSGPPPAGAPPGPPPGPPPQPPQGPPPGAPPQ